MYHYLKPSPPPQREVLIIPLRNLSSPSTAHPAPAPSPPTQTTPTPNGLPQATPTSPVSLPKQPSSGSQLFSELLEVHARRSQKTASPEPAAPIPRETTPTHVKSTPTEITTPPVQGSQLFSELLEVHARRSLKTASPEPAAPIPSETTPTHVKTTATEITTPPVQGSQLFSELLEVHARRSLKTASPEPAAPIPRETTPTHVKTTATLIITPTSLQLSPTTPTPPQLPSPTAQGGRGLSSPELIRELQQPHTLKHVSAHKGLTTVFSGRGRMPSSSLSSSTGSPTNRGQEKPQPLSNSTKS
ncbi:proteoglycan 4-like [Engraulis encrasicolus]|uniref:proteoglycan 4-like n=1 Tax=Engraulis encrasicolus TaxID=184585 RepID=UPI002FCF0206